MTKRRSFFTGLAAILAASQTPCFAQGDDDIDVAEARPRIVGGVKAADGAYPFQAAIFIGSGGRGLCGGSLIDAEWVLTAAHCVTKTNSKRKLPARDFSVQIGGGRIDGEDASDASGALIDVVRVIAHDRYDPRTFANDVALLKLKTAVREVTPIALAETLQADPKIEKGGAMLTVTGYGVTEKEGTEKSGSLQELQQPLVSLESCKRAYPKDTITIARLCVGADTDGRSACQGDSGGPLFRAQNPDDGGATPRPMRQHGIVSSGKHCAEAGKYGVYARVSHYERWIRRRVAGARFDASEAWDGARAQLRDLIEELETAAPGAERGGLSISIRGASTFAPGDARPLVLDVEADFAGRLIMFSVNSVNDFVQLRPSRQWGHEAFAVEAGTSVVPDPQAIAEYKFLRSTLPGRGMIVAILFEGGDVLDQFAQKYAGFGADVVNKAQYLDELRYHLTANDDRPTTATPPRRVAFATAEFTVARP